MRKPIAVLAVGVLVLLAGCSAVPFAGGSGEEIPSDEQSAEEFKQAHASALEEQGSFTTTVEVTQSQGDKSQTNTYMYEVDTASNQALSTVETPASAIQLYTAGDTTFVQQSAGNQTAYQMDSAPYDAAVQPVTTEEATLSNAVLPIGNVTYQETGTKMYNGVEVTVYEANEEEAKKALGGSDESKTTVESFESEIYVDENGIVRYQTVSYKMSANGKTLEASLELEITDVGSTTVEEPDWIDTAKEQAQEDESTNETNESG